MQQSLARALFIFGVVLALTKYVTAQNLFSYASPSASTCLSGASKDNSGLTSTAPRSVYGGRRSPQPHEHFNKLLFELGGGFNAPIGNDIPYITWGGNLTLGVGRQLTSHLATLFEYQFIDDKLPDAFLWAVGTPGGNTHIWSLTLDPIIYLHPANQKGWNVYAVGGGGYYHKTTNFNTSVPVVYCGYFGFCVGGYENAAVTSFPATRVLTSD